MTKLKVLGLLFTLACASVFAQLVDVTAVDGGRFTCRVDGVEVPTQHSAEYTAAERVANLTLLNPESTVICERTQSLVGRLTALGQEFVAKANAQIIVIDPPAVSNTAPSWNTTPSPSFTAGIAGVHALDVSDVDGDSLTITNTGDCTLPTGVTVDSANQELDASTGTSVGTTTGCILNADDGTTSTNSSSFSVVIAGNTNYTSWNAEGIDADGTGPIVGGTNTACADAVSISDLKGNAILSTTDPHQGTYSLRVTFDQGQNDNGCKALTPASTSVGSNFDGSTLYHRWWMKIDSAMDWGTSGNRVAKMGRLVGPSAPTHATALMFRDKFRFATEDEDSSGGISVDLDPDGGCTTSALLTGMTACTEWREYIIKWTRETCGACTDGEWHLYVDGELAGSETGRGFERLAITTSRDIKITWGGFATNFFDQLNSSPATGGYVYTDEISTDSTWNSTTYAAP